MKRSIASLSLMLICTSTLSKAQSKGNDCIMAVTYSEMAFKDFKNAFKSDTTDDVQTSTEAAVKNAVEAAAFSNICNCPLAKNYALNAVTFGNKALKETDPKKQKKLIKQAMDMSLDVMTTTPNCK